MNFLPPRWWAWLRLVLGAFCAMGFVLRATPTPGMYPGFFGMLLLDATFLYMALGGLQDLLRPRRVSVLDQGVGFGRKAAGPTLPFGDLNIKVEYVNAWEAAAGRFRILSIVAEGHVLRLHPWQIADRQGLTEALRAHRHEFRHFTEIVLGSVAPDA